MKSRNKITSVLAVAALLLSVQNAYAAAPDWTKFVGKPTKELCAGKTYKLGFDIFSDNESFALIVRKGMLATAKAMGCVKVEILSDNADPIKVQENLKIFIQKKYDGVMAAQVVAAAAPGAVRTMKDAKIPMVATEPLATASLVAFSKSSSSSMVTPLRPRPVSTLMCI